MMMRLLLFDLKHSVCVCVLGGGGVAVVKPSLAVLLLQRSHTQCLRPGMISSHWGSSRSHGLTLIPS